MEEYSAFVTDRRKPKYSERSLPSAILSSIGAAWTALGIQLGSQDRKPASNRMITVYIAISETDTDYWLKIRNENANFEACA